MKQQTAVEWLSEQFDSIVELYPSQFERVNRAIEQAKEMEKERMIEFGCLLTFESKHIIEEAYNEVYGGNK
jgi:hypothetical protein